MEPKLYAFPDRILNEVAKHNQDPRHFQPVGVHRETGEVGPCLWPIALPLGGSLFLASFSADESRRVERFYRITRANLTTFFVERITWKVGERTASDIVTEEKVTVPTENINLSSGIWSALELCRLYLQPQVEEVPASIFLEISNNFLLAITKGDAPGRIATTLTRWD